MQITVRAGQNLTNIARAQNTTVAALVQANNLSNPDRIIIGQQLTIPGSDDNSSVSLGASAASATNAPTAVGSTPDASTQSPVAPPRTPDVHVVVRIGQTLSNIAQRFHTTVAAIVQANNIQDDDLIVIGQKLTVPSGKDTPIAKICPKAEGDLPELPPETNTTPAQPKPVAPARAPRPTAPAHIAPLTNRAHLSESDIQALMRAVAAEARGEDHRTQVGIAQTIINYARQSGQSIPSLTRSSYLSSNDDGNSVFYRMSLGSLPNAQRIRAAVLEAADFRSPVGSRTHFHDTSINTPSWGNRQTRVQLGHVVFFNSK
jgi:LysM repeat protein